MLVRTWNLFHGNTEPPERRAFLARWSSSSPPTARTSSACRRCRSGRCRTSSGGAACARSAPSPRGRGSERRARRLAHRAPPRPAPLRAHRRGERDSRARRDLDGRGTSATLVVSRARRAPGLPRLRARRRLFVANFHITGRSPTSSSARVADFVASAGERGDPRRRREPAAGRGRTYDALRDGLLRAAAGQHRPDPRARPRRDAARRLARGAAPRRWPAPLGPRAGRTHRRMTFEEARAQFPVLERYAYLNAGTNGPLARATVDALVEQAQRDLERRAERQGVLRADARAARRRRAPGFAARARRRARADRARRLDVARLRDRARRARAHRRGRGGHDRPGALRPDRAAVRDGRARRDRRGATRTRSSPRSRRARG